MSQSDRPAEERSFRAALRSTLWGSLQDHQSFRWFWAAHTSSVIGSQVTTVALPLLAILTLDASSRQMGLLRAAGVLPALLFGLIAGVLVDRVQKTRLLVGADLGRAALLTLVSAVALAGLLRYELLLAVAFAAGTLTVLFDIARFSTLPAIVPRERLPEANAKLETSWSGASIAGPGLGGLLVQLVTAPIAILVDAGSFVASALYLRRLPAESRDTTPPARKVGVVSEIRDGLRFVARHPYLRPIALANAIFIIGFGAYSSLYLLYLARDRDLSPTAIGLVVACSGPGYLLGALAASRITERAGVGRSLLLAQLGAGIIFVALPLARGPDAMLIVTLGTLGLINGVLAQVSGINQISLRQQVTPPEMMGRANATMRVIAWSGAPLAAIAGGILGQWLGLRVALLLAGIAMAASALPYARSSIRRLRTFDQLPQGA